MRVGEKRGGSSLDMRRGHVCQVGAGYVILVSRGSEKSLLSCMYGQGVDMLGCV